MISSTTQAPASRIAASQGPLRFNECGNGEIHFFPDVDEQGIEGAAEVGFVVLNARDYADAKRMVEKFTGLIQQRGVIISDED